jgi:hypothetical protein
MMRTKTGFLYVVAALALGACSWGGDSGGSNTQPDASIGGGDVVCGDNVCAASEVGSCPQDCGNSGSNNPHYVCGNDQCESTLGESATNCPDDCGGGNGSGSGSGSGSSGGNTTLDCSDPLTTFSCALCTLGGQCSPPYDAVSCAACGTGFGNCTGGLPDGTCDANEDSTSCPLDCM